ncbi:MAG: GAF domain-containing protein [Anaerolineae bacterium]|nr:GAF domain-containing protein [Anaerolineae bacterium]
MNDNYNTISELHGINEHESARSIDDPGAEFRRGRQKLLYQFQWISAIVLLPLVGWGLYRMYQRGQVLGSLLISLSYIGLLIGVGLMGFAKRKEARLQEASMVYAALFVGVVFVGAVGELFTYGWEWNSRLLLLACVVFAAIFINRRASLVTLALASVFLGTFVMGKQMGYFATAGVYFEFDLLLSGWVLFVLCGGGIVTALGYLLPQAFSQMQRAVQRVAMLAQEREAIDERMHTLQIANLSFQRRAMYLEASIQVSHAFSTVFEVQSLLEQAVNLITDNFGFYHTGIFLLDEAGEWAVLRAASSAGGRKMLAREHKLHRGEDSMVGWVMQHREPRIAENVGEDAVHFVNPDLPATRSEVSLPLIVFGKLIGVLDVQSTEENAFDEDDVRSLMGLTGQLAVAINNAQRLSEEAALLEATSPFYRLARQLAATRTAREIYAAILETVRNFNPTRAFILRSGGEHTDIYATDTFSLSVDIVAEMLRGTVNFIDPEFQSPAQRESVFEYATALIAFSRTLSAPLLLDDPEILFNEDLLLANDASLPNDVLDTHKEAIVHLIEQSESRSIALVPIPVVAGIQTLLVVSYDSPHKFSGMEEQLYQVLADLAEVALERVQLVRSAQRRLNEERWMREFTEQMMRVPTLPAVVEQATKSLQTLVNADGVLITLLPGE